MNKENLQIGDILQSEQEGRAFVDKILPKKVRVWINGERKYILDEELSNWEYANPIRNNRLVGGQTFAVRFKQFLEWIPRNWWMSQPHYYDEFEYMMNVANQLLKYQIQTVTEQEEINYLKRLELL